MAVKTDFYYDSCGKGKIHAACWEPAGDPVGVVQLVHGIAEHVARYDDYAAFLTDNGFVVVAEDHMGHGLSVGKKDTKGYFHGGWFQAVGDTLCLMNMTMEKYPGVPYFLFGHSMGSFIARTILAKYPNSGIHGAVICGTAWQSPALLAAALPLSKLICRMDGETNPSKKLQSLMFGSYNKRVEHVRSQNDWLSRDAKVVEQYDLDPMCGFTATAGLYRDMLSGIRYIQEESSLQNMKKDLPVLFVAGSDDPVGSYGTGVEMAADKFRCAGMENVELKLYPLCRHEILNEINKEEVYADTLNWMKRWL